MSDILILKLQLDMIHKQPHSIVYQLWWMVQVIRQDEAVLNCAQNHVFNSQMLELRTDKRIKLLLSCVH